jgi:uncharacterized UPF0146 family protein
LSTFENLNIEYENVYSDNKFKKACITTAIFLLDLVSSVLDLGCRACVPVADMLSQAGLDVVGFDITPKDGSARRVTR